MSVSIAAGTPFVVQMSDYRTTGFLWFLDSVAPADIATYHSNISAGGVTGPPYKNVSFTAGPGTGEGLIVMEHVRGWQRADPAADRGFARLHLSVHGAGPSPAPPSPAANKTHYGDPSTGCMSDEQVVQITGVKGAFCAPDCAAAACPADVPAGSTAQPQCALAGSTGSDKKCALVCAASADEASLRAGDAQCGAGASCKAIQSTGICTYDDSEDGRGGEQVKRVKQVKHVKPAPHTVSPMSASALSGAGGFLSLPRVGTCNCFNTCSCKDWACCCQCNDCKNDPAVAPHCQ